MNFILKNKIPDKIAVLLIFTFLRMKKCAPPYTSPNWWIISQVTGDGGVYSRGSISQQWLELSACGWDKIIS
jgi:hypothetical protein